jgi:uncharacterized Zn-finger protein
MASSAAISTQDIGTVERIEVDSRVAACDGGGGVLGHPLVYLRIVDREVTCPYCSRLYVLKPGAGDGHEH